MTDGQTQQLKKHGGGKKKPRGGKIEAYLDCVSPYSFYALKHLLEQRPALATYGIEIEFIPVFLGGINHGSGNQPPWTLPAKAKYSKYDTKRANAWFGLPELRSMEWFPIVSLLPQRLLAYLHALSSSSNSNSNTNTNTKANVQEIYETTFLSLFAALWLPPQTDISIPANLISVLSSIPSPSSTPLNPSHPINPLSLPKTTTLLFSASEIEELLSKASDPATKAKLTANTKAALERGAFGCPWFWVTRYDEEENGKGEPFFGSDRFGYMFAFLGVEVSGRGDEVVPFTVGQEAGRSKL